MSSFVCGEKTLSLIARSFVNYGVDFDDGKPKDTMCLIMVNKEVSRIFESLLKTNLDSINNRYEDDCLNFDDLNLVELDNETQTDVGKIIGCIDCYDYQASEAEGYYESKTYYSLRNLRNTVIERFIEQSGYEISWGID